jgi:PAS domain S-box-containing protein
MTIDSPELPFRELVDAAPDGVVVCDHGGKIVLVNAEAERMFGYARDELLGQQIDVLVPERVRKHHGAHVNGYTSAPRCPMGSGMELSGRKKDGTEVPVEISLSPINTSRGRLVTAGIRDVGERRELERENRRANAYLVSAVDSVREAFALFDESDRVIMVNSAGRQLLGSAVGGAIVGLPFDQLLDRRCTRACSTCRTGTRESLYKRWLAYRASPPARSVRTGTGRYLRVIATKTAEHGTVSTIADVTDDVLHADELHHAREMPRPRSAARRVLVVDESRARTRSMRSWGSRSCSSAIASGRSMTVSSSGSATCCAAASTCCVSSTTCSISHVSRPARSPSRPSR